MLMQAIAELEYLKDKMYQLERVLQRHPEATVNETVAELLNDYIEEIDEIAILVSEQI